jgi:hypothetical protein
MKFDLIFRLSSKHNLYVLVHVLTGSVILSIAKDLAQPTGSILDKI